MDEYIHAVVIVIVKYRNCISEVLKTKREPSNSASGFMFNYINHNADIYTRTDRFIVSGCSM